MREDQPFVAPNDVSLRQADEANAEVTEAADIALDDIACEIYRKAKG